MTLIEQLQEARKLAGLPAMSPDKANDIAKKNKDKKEIFAAGKLAKDDPARKDDDKKTKKDKDVDDGRPGPSKGARDAMDSGTIKPAKKKKKVSEEINDALLASGVTKLTVEQAMVFDREQSIIEMKDVEPMPGADSAVNKIAKRYFSKLDDAGQKDSMAALKEAYSRGYTDGYNSR